MGEINFQQIHPRAFMHPADRRATSAFEKVPFFPELSAKISQYGIEERFRAHHMCSSVLVGPHQLRPIYLMVNQVAERLGIPVPPTYIARSGEANAYAFGRHQHSIVLTSELVDILSDEALEGVIAHEMGHILCEHMLYMDVGLSLSSTALPVLKRIPGFEETISGLFFTWFRAAEYSADRAALLILDDPMPLANALARLAGVPKRLLGEFDLKRFTEQASNFDEQATWWTKVVTFGMDAFQTHPEPSRRVGALLDWAESDEFRAIRRGDYLTRFEAEAIDRVQIIGVASCPLCGSPVGKASVCPVCHLDQDPQRQQACPRGHAAGLAWKFCKACGKPLTGIATHSEIPDH